MTHVIKIVEAPRKRSMCETKMRYDVMLNGEVFDTLYFNTRGYLGYLPLPGGEKRVFVSCGCCAG